MFLGMFSLISVNRRLILPTIHHLLTPEDQMLLLQGLVLFRSYENI